MLKLIFQKMSQKGFLGVLRFVIALPYIFLRNLRRKKIFQLQNLDERFSYIYEKNHWQSRESRSGEGSEIAYTENLRNKLTEIIEYYGIQNVVDAPCGDYNWMKKLRKTSHFSYIGIDIV